MHLAKKEEVFIVLRTLLYFQMIFFLFILNLIYRLYMVIRSRNFIETKLIYENAWIKFQD